MRSKRRSANPRFRDLNPRAQQGPQEPVGHPAQGQYKSQCYSLSTCRLAVYGLAHSRRHGYFDAAALQIDCLDSIRFDVEPVQNNARELRRTTALRDIADLFAAGARHHAPVKLFRHDPVLGIVQKTSHWRVRRGIPLCRRKFLQKRRYKQSRCSRHRNLQPPSDCIANGQFSICHLPTLRDLYIVRDDQRVQTTSGIRNRSNDLCGGDLGRHRYIFIGSSIFVDYRN